VTAPLPETRDTLVAALASTGDEARGRALDLIARAYHAPVVALLARRWLLDRADAEDLAQEFFAHAIEKDWFTRYDPARGRFRPFLRSCLDDFARSEFRDAGRLKRGGGAAHIALTEVEVADADPGIDRLFEQEWARSVLSLASGRLRDECTGTARESAWRIFERYDLTDAPDDRRPTYAMLALELGLPTTQVTNHLAWARRRMREHVLATVRLLTGDETEYRDEVRALLGIEAP
jgi:DNA-directed RNA polymerase specialized sigma24 family protein